MTNHANTLMTTIALIACLLFAPMVVDAQQAGKPARIGTIFSGTVATHGKFLIWFRQGMSELGYAEGRNYIFVSRWGTGKPERLPALAKELVKAKVDVILVNGSPVIRAVMKATQDIPIVVGSSGILAKFVATLARPGGNITGSTFSSRALWTKRLGLLQEALPGARRVAFLFFSPDKMPTKRLERDLKRIETAGKTLGIKIQPMQAPTLGDVENAFVSMADAHTDAVIINRELFSRFHQKRLAALAITKKLPSACDHESFARAGCLMSYAPDRKQLARRAAAFVDRILKGTKPADLPVEMATRYKLVVNLKTAKSLGLTLPPSILLQATEVIE